MNQIIPHHPSPALVAAAPFAALPAPTHRARFSMQSDFSREQLHRITTLIKLAGSASPRALQDKTGLLQADLSRYLKHLVRTGAVHLVAKASNVLGARRDAIYAYGPEPVDEEGDPGMGFTRIVTSDWQPGAHARDALHAALFGPARCVGCKEPQGEPHAAGCQFRTAT